MERIRLVEEAMVKREDGIKREGVDVKQEPGFIKQEDHIQREGLDVKQEPGFIKQEDMIHCSSSGSFLLDGQDDVKQEPGRGAMDESGGLSSRRAVELGVDENGTDHVQHRRGKEQSSSEKNTTGGVKVKQEDGGTGGSIPLGGRSSAASKKFALPSEASVEQDMLVSLVQRTERIAPTVDIRRDDWVKSAKCFHTSQLSLWRREVGTISSALVHPPASHIFHSIKSDSVFKQPFVFKFNIGGACNPVFT